MIFDQLGIKKHGIVIDMTNNAIVFGASYYIYTGTSFFIILDQVISVMKIMSTKIKQDILSNKIIKKISKKCS